MNRPRVLIADDNDIFRCSIVELLDDECFVVGAVVNGDELVEAATRLRPDVIVSDIMMPRMNGLAAREMLIAKRRSIPFVFVSTLGKEVAHSLGPCASPVAFVYKLDMPAHLQSAVEAVLSGRPYLSPHYME